jgi:hypothetical protein
LEISLNEWGSPGPLSQNPGSAPARYLDGCPSDFGNQPNFAFCIGLYFSVQLFGFPFEYGLSSAI